MEDRGFIPVEEFDGEIPFCEGGSDSSEQEKSTEVDVVGTCPVCGKGVIDHEKAYFCEDYDCQFALWKNNRFFQSISKEMTRELAVELLSNGEAKLERCQSVRTGRVFNCIVKLNTDEDGRAQFSLEFPKRKKKQED